MYIYYYIILYYIILYYIILYYIILYYIILYYIILYIINIHMQNIFTFGSSKGAIKTCGFLKLLEDPCPADISHLPKAQSSNLQRSHQHPGVDISVNLQ